MIYSSAEQDSRAARQGLWVEPSTTPPGIDEPVEAPDQSIVVEYPQSQGHTPSNRAQTFFAFLGRTPALAEAQSDADWSLGLI